MKDKIQITPLAHKSLTAKKREFLRVIERLKKSKTNQAGLNKYRHDLAEVEEILARADVTEFSEKQPATVLIGTKVVLESLKPKIKESILLCPE